jgi:hypothetical protein
MYNLILGIVKFSERRIEQCEDEEEFLKCFEYDLSTDEKVVEVREKIIEFGREFTISKALLDKIEEMFKESDEYRYNADMDMEDEKGSDEGDEEERMGMGIGIGIGGNNERNRIRDLMEEIKMKVSDGDMDRDGEEEEEGSEDGKEKGRRRVMRKDDGDNANSDGEGDSEEEEESDVGYKKKKKKKNNNNSNDDDGDSMEVNSEHIPNSLSNINLSYLNEEHFNYNVKDVHRNNCDYEQPTNEVTLLIKDGIQNDSRLSDVSLDDDDL